MYFKLSDTRRKILKYQNSSGLISHFNKPNLICTNEYACTCSYTYLKKLATKKILLFKIKYIIRK